MRGRLVLGFACVLAATSGVAAEEGVPVERGVIRLQLPDADAAEAPTDDPKLGDSGLEARRGFDYQAFGSRLEGYWFQRKLHLREGRDEEASRQADAIRSFTAEEGVRRLELPAGALVSEAERLIREGHHSRALASLALADALDPDRPQAHFLRARIAWESNGGTLAAAGEFLSGLRASARSLLRQPVRLHANALLIVLAVQLATLAFAALMAWRYHVPLRHEVEEALTRSGREVAAPAAGWLILLWPLVLVVTAGWIGWWWLVATFRYMRRSERLVAVALLALAALSVPGYRLAVGLYGVSADPRVRTTMAAASGTYEPDRVVKLQQMVAASPDDPTPRFLLAGMYKNGRYFEEAFEEYKRVLKVAPETWQARVNIGNIFFAMGQYGEAIAQYQKAIDMRPRDVLAYCNMHLAQNDALRLNEAAATYQRARAIDAPRVEQLLRPRADRTVVDATINLSSVWRAALEGERLEDWLRADGSGSAAGLVSLLRSLLNPLSVVSLAALAACLLVSLGPRHRPPARRCTRCGRPYCAHCRTSREPQEFCSQCVHLFVLQDGLAPQTKIRKLYEIETHGKRSRLARQLGSLVLPGAGAVLRGRALVGFALLFGWFAGWLAVRPSSLRAVEAVLGLDAHLDLLRWGAVPAVLDFDPALLAGLPLLVVVWILGNAWIRRPREA
ncbi:MAG TPA: tetratricopeptide repeat protein [Candidatus Polarisedimenticolaceae bacterium]